MAKGAYIGVNGVARRIKKGYIGTNAQSSTSITVTNITNFFQVTNASYYFAGNGSVFTSNNSAKSSSVAQTTLKALRSMEISFTYSYSTETSYDKFTLVVAGQTVENGVSGPTATKSYSGRILEGQEIIFKYSKDTSVDGNNDKCTFSNMVVSTSVARFIKRAYVGIGGVARPCWHGGEIQRYGPITNLSSPRIPMAATSTSKYAIIAGGYTTSTSFGVTTTNRYNTIDVYNSKLTHSASTMTLSQKKTNGAATTVGDCAIFAGGQISTGRSAVADAYNNALTQQLGISKLSTGRSYLAATTVGRYAVFAGGSTLTGYSGAVDVYDDQLTQQVNVATLSQSRACLAATTIGNYALFAGGSNSSTVFSTVDAYHSESLTQVLTPTGLLDPREDLSAASAGAYAFFAGGHYPEGSLSSMTDAYNETLTRFTATGLSTNRAFVAATTLGHYAMFIGGSNTSVVDVYNGSFAREIIDGLSKTVTYGVATSIGYYAVFAGGTLSIDNFFVEAYSV